MALGKNLTMRIDSLEKATRDVLIISLSVLIAFHSHVPGLLPSQDPGSGNMLSP